jgi:fructosamine-3-kinase
VGPGIVDIRALGGQHGVAHYRLELPGGQAAFAKLAPAGSADLDPADSDPASPGSAGAGLDAEASGLRWLGAAAAVPVPDVLAADDHALVMSWIAAGEADRRSALRFGRELAVLHAAGAAGFGAPWPAVIAGLPLPNGEADADAGDPDWSAWYPAARLLPYVRIGRDRGALTAGDAAVIEAAAARVAAVGGPPEPPSRIHGDCWSGNVLWSGGRGVLIDPAAHGGHRESDLAMLALFGAPHRPEILAGYQETAPLADGWAARVPLHQLHPLLVHVCLFGTAYTAPAVAAARAVLAL